MGISGLLTPMTPEEFEAVPVSAVGEARASVPSSVGVEEILEEADFYVAQGLFEEARETLEDALAAHPGHRLLRDKLDEVAEAEAAAGTTAASIAPPPSETNDDDAAFALAEKLAEELGPEETAPTNDILDVDEVFAQFKKGVEAQIDASDSETHYDLGIAYKEMGLLDDAVHEFELAMANPRKECLAATMIGLCHVEKNDAATRHPLLRASARRPADRSAREARDLVRARLRVRPARRQRARPLLLRSRARDRAAVPKRRRAYPFAHPGAGGDLVVRSGRSRQGVRRAARRLMATPSRADPRLTSVARHSKGHRRSRQRERPRFFQIASEGSAWFSV